MDFNTINVQLVIQLLLLMLIGLGPKIALVPFLDETKGLTREEKRRVGERTVKVAVVTAVLLFATGALLMRLLHISPGAVSVAGGLVLLRLALRMVGSPGEEKHVEEGTKDLDKLAVFPLAVPYLLNPVGMTVLIVASDGVDSVAAVAVVLAVIAVVGAFDWLVFRNTDKIASRLNPTSMAVSEVVFGILLTAVAIQLMFYGLVSFGIVEGAAH